MVSSDAYFGNALHNLERYIDAAEVYLRACILDPDDAGGFAQFADEVSSAVRRQKIQEVLGNESGRKLPEGIDLSTVEQSLCAAFSCSAINQSDLDRCKRTAARAQIDLNHFGHLLGLSDLRDNGHRRMSVPERLALASQLYDVFRSSLTDPEYAKRMAAANS
jgi:hypothetical protein